MSSTSSLLPLVRCCLLGSTHGLQSWRALSTAGVGHSRIAILESRGVLQAEGPQVLGFLQGIVTNDVRSLENAGPSQPPVYANILTPKGKFLHDVFIFPHPDRPGAVLLDVHRRGARAALQLLNRYKLRRPLKFSDASSQFTVAALWGASSPPSGGWWRPDPRLPELGYRALIPAAETSVLGATASEEDFKALRYRLGVAEGEWEIPSGEAAPLDYNADALHGVSYTKGCYVGQERNSFTHYRGVIRKRLMPVRLELDEPTTEEAPAAQSAADQGSGTGSASAGPSSGAIKAPRDFLLPIGAEVIDAANGRVVGEIRGAAEAACSDGCDGAGAAVGHGSGKAVVGIAYLRLDSALAAAEGRGVELLAASLPMPTWVGEAEEEEGASSLAEGGVEARAGAETGAQQPGADWGRYEVEDDAEAVVWRVVPVRPEWWPAEWGREEGAGATAGGV